MSTESSFDKIARSVLDSLVEGCQVIGRDWRYLYVNDSVANQGGRAKDELLGRTMMECYPGIEATPMFGLLRRCMSARVHERMENEFKFPDGSTGWFELRFVPVPEGVCILSLDTTTEKRSREALHKSEEQLRQAQKMEAVGRLAGGVAHDFNNLLSVILSYASLCIADLPAESAMRADIVEIENAGKRAAALTHQLLAFTRHQVVETRVLDLNAVVGAADKMLRRLVSEDIVLMSRLSHDVGRIRADSGQVEQVLMNLVVNARDAMPRGGQLTIETANVDLDEGYAREHLGAVPGPYVVLAVSDTGIGIDKETQLRIFEPFFTTKETGKGTGLGLSTVFGIAQRCGGCVWVYSEVGRGTTFKVYFPRTDEHEVLARAPPPTTTLGGTETILLVEDEEPLRVVARSILAKSGYRVLEAGRGTDALALGDAHDGPVHLLLTDVVMPEMNGPEIASRLSARRPELRVLYMSGYTADAIAHHRVVESGTNLLQKPITPASLLRKVREVLDA